mgnify:CR=1 FL=1
MMAHPQEWNFSRWNDNSKTMFLDSRFCMWEQGGRIYFKDTRTQSKTSLMEVYNGSVKKGFQRALVHFENFISIAKVEMK